MSQGAIMMFGLIGACLSGILSLSRDPSHGKIPDLLFTGLMALARLVVGVPAAIAIHLMMLSNLIALSELVLTPPL